MLGRPVFVTLASLPRKSMEKGRNVAPQWVCWTFLAVSSIALGYGQQRLTRVVTRSGETLARRLRLVLLGVRAGEPRRLSVDDKKPPTGSHWVVSAGRGRGIKKQTTEIRGWGGRRTVGNRGGPFRDRLSRIGP